MSISKMIESAREKLIYWETLTNKLQEMEVQTQETEESIRKLIADYMILAPDETPTLVEKLLQTIVLMYPQTLKKTGLLSRISELVKETSVESTDDRQQSPASPDAAFTTITANVTIAEGKEITQKKDAVPELSWGKYASNGRTMNLVAASPDRNSGEDSADISTDAEADAADIQQSLSPGSAAPEVQKTEEAAEMRFNLEEWTVEVEPRIIENGEQDGYRFFFFRDKKNEGFGELLTGEQLGDRSIEEYAREYAQQVLDRKDELQEEVPYDVPPHSTFLLGEWKVVADRRTDEAGEFAGVDFQFSHTKMQKPSFTAILNVEQMDERTPRNCAQQILDDRESEKEDLPAPDADGFIKLTNAVRYKSKGNSVIEARLGFNNRTPDGRKTSTNAKNRANKWAESLESGLEVNCEVESTGLKDPVYEVRIKGCSLAQLQAIANKNFSELPPNAECFRQQYFHLKDSDAAAE